MKTRQITRLLALPLLAIELIGVVWAVIVIWSPHQPSGTGSAPVAAASAPVAQVDRSVGYVSTLSSLLDGAGGDSIGTISPGTPVKILSTDDAYTNVRIDGWSPTGGARYLFKDMGVRIFRVILTDKGVEVRTVAGTKTDDWDSTWEDSEITGWLDTKDLVADPETVWDEAAPLYYGRCSRCHSLRKPREFTANQWPSVLKIMTVRAGFSKEQSALVTALLQNHARDQVGEDVFSQKVATADTTVKGPQVAEIKGTPALATKGKEVFENVACYGCHGEGAQFPIQSDYPKLVGQNAEYIYKQVTDFHSGARTNDPDEVMRTTIADLSDADITAVAYYISTLKIAKAPPADTDIPEPAIKGSPALFAKGKAVFDAEACSACHGEDAKTPAIIDYPRLALQNVDYLVRQMLDFKSGARSNDADAVMRDKVSGLDQDSIEAVSYYLSTLGAAKSGSTSTSGGRR